MCKALHGSWNSLFIGFRESESCFLGGCSSVGVFFWDIVNMHKALLPFSVYRNVSVDSDLFKTIVS